METYERVKELRKNHLRLSQSAFGERLGVSRDVIKNIELNALAKPEQKLSLLKLICKEFGVNEEWLLNGTGSMFAQPTTFSLDDFAKSKGATPLELKIMKTYFELDPDIRKAAMDFFKKQLLSAVAADPGLLIPDDQEDLEKLNPPAEAGNGTRKEVSQKAPSLPELG